MPNNCNNDGAGDGSMKCTNARGMMQDWGDARVLDTLVDDGGGDGSDIAIRRALAKLQKRDPDLADRLLLLIEQFLVTTKRKKMGGTFSLLDMEFFRKFLAIPQAGKPPPTFPVDPTLIDFLEEQNYLREVGVGLSWEEAMSVTISIHCIIKAANYIKTARFWGKILGQTDDYYVVECDSPAGSPVQAMMETGHDGEGYEGDNDGEELFGLEGNNYLNILKNFEQVEANYRKRYNKQKLLKYPIDNLDVKIQQLKMAKPRIDYIIFPPQPTVYVEPDAEVPPEQFGRGTNSKVYMVSNSPNGPWAELPNVTPQQIVIARETRLFFSGNLCKEIDTNPPFPGTERNYLRAQIARITSGTHVSPMNFYHFPGGEEEDENGGEDNENEIVLNTEYQPLSPEDLIGERGLDYWVHHTPYILEHGTCSMWSENEGSWGEEPPPILRPIVCDTEGPGWWPEAAECIGTRREAVLVRSLAWPGAVAWTAGRRAGCFYHGLGQKNPIPIPKHARPVAEYSVGPDISEFDDPTVEATQEWVAERQGPNWDMPGEGGEGQEGMLPNDMGDQNYQGKDDL